MRIPDYPKVYALGHREVRPIFTAPVSVEEKVDGSQISFAKIDGELHIRSKGQVIDIDNPPKLFGRAVATIVSKADLLKEGFVYRGEAICTPRHNVLEYGRAPEGGVILFDVEDDLLGSPLYPTNRESEARRLGFESVPFEWIADPSIIDEAFIAERLDRESSLGGPKYEGVVFKSFDLYGADKKKLVAKFVSEAFKEQHGAKHSRQSLPGGYSPAELIASDYCTAARWQKSVQHLREDGQLTDSPKDIGALLQAIHADMDAECADEVGRRLYATYRKDIMRRVQHGFPEWYKEQLMHQQFEEAA